MASGSPTGEPALDLTGRHSNICSLPPAVVGQRTARLFFAARPQRPATRLCLFRGGAGPPIGRQAAHQRRGAADRGEHCQAAGAIAQGLMEKSVSPKTAKHALEPRTRWPKRRHRCGGDVAWLHWRAWSLGSVLLGRCFNLNSTNGVL
jgi:hypothetical protein